VTSTIFHDKSMLFLVLIVAFFVGASATNALMDDAFAGNHGNNGNNGCENANPNAKACENNPNTPPSIDPTTGQGPDIFTITDPQGRMQAGDVAVFEHTTNNDFDFVVVGNTISPDGTTLTGTLPSIMGGEYLVSVESSGGVERFSGISFFVIVPPCPPNCE